MRVLTLSDVVVDALNSAALDQLARGVEMVLSCGDLPADYLEFIVSTLNVPLFYVMGNHGGSGSARTYPEGCENIDARALEYKGVLLAGFQGSMRYNDRPEFQYTENQMWMRVVGLTPHLLGNRLRHGRYLDVLVTHAPPYHIHDSKDLPHHGFKAFLWLIDHYQPGYVVHGHKHVYDTREETVTRHGPTTVVNTYGFRVLEIETNLRRKQEEYALQQPNGI